MRSRVSKTQPARGSTEAACQLIIRSPKSEVRRNTEISIAKPEAVGVLDRASRCRSSQAVPSGDSDLELRVCFGLRDSNFGFHVGSWQTSNAPALQAGPCGSVTRRLHQPSPSACRRAKAAHRRSDEGGLHSTLPLAAARQAISETRRETGGGARSARFSAASVVHFRLIDGGELDLSTERSPMGFCRWVRPPPPLPSTGKRSGCPAVTRVSQNEPEATTGALPALPTSLRPSAEGGRRLSRRSATREDGRFNPPGIRSAGHSGPVAQTRGATRCLREGCGGKSHRARHSPIGIRPRRPNSDPNAKLKPGLRRAGATYRPSRAGPIRIPYEP